MERVNTTLHFQVLRRDKVLEGDERIKHKYWKQGENASFLSPAADTSMGKQCENGNLEEMLVPPPSNRGTGSDVSLGWYKDDGEGDILSVVGDFTTRNHIRKLWIFYSNLALDLII
ncbi:hypothetical protein L2E82_05320 [Cichorium intybus]|uniref:Uncharacterized protein n=1 Tax=Cichorium intybus TaxID=13427 RepID=A0ACB9H8P4_CICIN|nr:hypothetical protein L2E82_05320 [Cichorium intybus]